MAKRKLYTGQPGDTSAAAYTSTNVYTSIFAATVTNPTGSAETLDVWLVPSGGSATDSTKIYDGFSVGANGQAGLQYLINQTLEPGDAIHMAAGTASTLTVHISGDVTTT